MKKIISIFVCLIIIILNNATSFAAEECHKFSEVDDYFDLVYTTGRHSTNGGYYYCSDNISLSSLPYGMMNDGAIRSFAIYNNRIYYKTGEEGSSDLSAPDKIYSCDMLGQDNRLIADNVKNFCNVYIVDGWIYYVGFYGDIFKINLYSCEFSKLVQYNSDKYLNLNYCDSNFIYYSIGYDINSDCYAISADGSICYNMSYWTDEYYDKLTLKGDYSFEITDNGIYRNIRNSADRNTFKMILPIKYFSYPEIQNVTDRYVYFTSLEYPKIKLYRTER